MGWGKSSSSDSTPVVYETTSSESSSFDIEAIMSAMTEMYSGLAEQYSSMYDDLEAATAPEVETVDDIDWTEEASQLLQEASAEYNATEAARKTAASTVLTSPLLDEEDAETTTSILSGGV